MSESPPVQLDYAPDAPLHRRRRIRRAIIAVVALSILFATWHFGPRGYQRLRDAYYLRQCMNYTAPADRVVYEEDPQEFAALLAKPGYVKSYHSPGYHDHVDFVEPMKQRWDSWGAELPTLFMHVRQAPGKDPRLVLIWVARNGSHSTNDSSSTDWQVRLNLMAKVRTPGGDVETWDYPPALRPYHATGDLPADDPLNIRLYAGQPDPNDPAHFTIPYRIGKFAGTLDCYLKSNDKVEFKPPGVSQP